MSLLSRPITLFLLQHFFILLSTASTDFSSCCTKAPVPYDLKPFQWAACHSVFNESETDPLKRFAPTISATLDWCRKNCEYNGMFNISETNQWLTPFVTWVIPATAMLFLCPISEHLLPPKDLPTWKICLNECVFNWLDTTLEYLMILGDPVSAFNGALTQMLNDLVLCICLKRPENSHREKALIVTVLLAEQVDIDTPIVRTTFQILAGLDKAQEYSKTACRTMMAARKKFHMSITLPVVFYIGVAAAIFFDAFGKLGDNDTSHSLAYGIWYNWIILLSIFSNCSASHISPEAIRSSLETILRGVIENHSWIEASKLSWDQSMGSAWLLYQHASISLLSQKMKSTLPLSSPSSSASASSASSSSSSSSALGYPNNNNLENYSTARQYPGTIEVHALPLADRYYNSLKWNKWLFDKGVDVCKPSSGILRYNPIQINHWQRPRPKTRYLISQTISWSFVSFPCFCAGFISFTTPNIGLGCRSVNHLTYAFLTLLVAWLKVFSGGDNDKEKRSGWKLMVWRTQKMLVWINAVVVLVGGTALQLMGAYRTCFCAAGFFASPDTWISLGRNTFEQQFWAELVWLNMAYLMYGWIVAVALAALVVRLYISYTIRGFLDI